MAAYAIRFQTEISMDVHASTREEAVHGAKEFLAAMEPSKDFLGGYNSVSGRQGTKIVFVGVNEDCTFEVLG